MYWNLYDEMTDRFGFFLFLARVFGFQSVCDMLDCDRTDMVKSDSIYDPIWSYLVGYGLVHSWRLEKIWRAGQIMKEMKESGNDRRERILVIPVSHLLEAAAGLSQMSFPPEIPIDAIPQWIYPDSSVPNSICLVVRHPSFEITSTGSVLPRYHMLIAPLPAPIDVEELLESEAPAGLTIEDEGREI